MLTGRKFAALPWYVAAAILATACSAQANSTKRLYAFKGSPDGASPASGLTADEMGNFYGTTQYGGKNNGTIFELTARGKEKVLYRFAGGNLGQSPETGVVFDREGDLYGTSTTNGDNPCGDVFKLAPDGTGNTVYAFKSGNDGCEPFDLSIDGEGNLYGVTLSGGAANSGTVFKVAQNGTETVLYSFKGGSDGKAPIGKLIADDKGNLYGTTSSGGASAGHAGTVFRLALDGTKTVLYSFQGGSDGSFPNSGVIFDASGNLYGTTEQGGTAGLGQGTVFKIASNGTKTILHSFQGAKDGSLPEGGLIIDASGNLYGTTAEGGSAKRCGTVFKLTPDGIETILHVFFDGPNGCNPSGLIGDSEFVYGTTFGNGEGPSDNGAIFRVRK